MRYHYEWHLWRRKAINRGWWVTPLLTIKAESGVVLWVSASAVISWLNKTCSIRATIYLGVSQNNRLVSREYTNAANRTQHQVYCLKACLPTRCPPHPALLPGKTQSCSKKTKLTTLPDHTQLYFTLPWSNCFHTYLYNSFKQPTHPFFERTRERAHVQHLLHLTSS